MTTTQTTLPIEHFIDEKFRYIPGFATVTDYTGFVAQQFPGEFSEENIVKILQESDSGIQCLYFPYKIHELPEFGKEFFENLWRKHKIIAQHSTFLDREEYLFSQSKFPEFDFIQFGMIMESQYKKNGSKYDFTLWKVLAGFPELSEFLADNYPHKKIYLDSENIQEVSSNVIYKNQKFKRISGRKTIIPRVQFWGELSRNIILYWKGETAYNTKDKRLFMWIHFKEPTLIQRFKNWYNNL